MTTDAAKERKADHIRQYVNAVQAGAIGGALTGRLLHSKGAKIGALAGLAGTVAGRAALTPKVSKLENKGKPVRAQLLASTPALAASSIGIAAVLGRKRATKVASDLGEQFRSFRRTAKMSPSDYHHIINPPTAGLLKRYAMNATDQLEEILQFAAKPLRKLSDIIPKKMTAEEVEKAEERLRKKMKPGKLAPMDNMPGTGSAYLSAKEELDGILEFVRGDQILKLMPRMSMTREMGDGFEAVIRKKPELLAKYAADAGEVAELPGIINAQRRELAPSVSSLNKKRHLSRKLDAFSKLLDARIASLSARDELEGILEFDSIIELAAFNDYMQRNATGLASALGRDQAITTGLRIGRALRPITAVAAIGALGYGAYRAMRPKSRPIPGRQGQQFSARSQPGEIKLSGSIQDWTDNSGAKRRDYIEQDDPPRPIGRLDSAAKPRSPLLSRLNAGASAIPNIKDKLLKSVGYKGVDPAWRGNFSAREELDAILQFGIDPRSRNQLGQFSGDNGEGISPDAMAITYKQQAIHGAGSGLTRGVGAGLAGGAVSGVGALGAQSAIKALLKKVRGAK